MARRERKPAPIASRWPRSSAMPSGIGRAFVDDSRIEMDTNTVERALRPIALNRKNAPFAGHDRGATRLGIVASSVETCKPNGVDPQAYLADILTRFVNGQPTRQIDDLMPWAYKTSHVVWATT